MIPYSVSSPRPATPIVIVLPPMAHALQPTQTSKAAAATAHPHTASQNKGNPISIPRETAKAAGIDVGKLLIAASIVSGAGLVFHSIDQKMMGSFFYSLSQKFSYRQQLHEKLWELKWVPALAAVTKLSDALLSLPVKMIETGRFNPYPPVPVVQEIKHVS